MIKKTTIDIIKQNTYGEGGLRTDYFLEKEGILNFLREYKLFIFSREKDETFELKKQLVEVVEEIEKELENLGK